MPLDQEKLDALRLDRSATGDHHGGAGKWWLVAGLVLLVGIAGLWVMMADEDLVVRVATAGAPGNNSVSNAVLSASGYVVARRLATVSSKVTGKINEVLIEEGAMVDTGQVLARLDDSTVRARLVLAQSQAAAALDRLREIRVRLEESRRNLERTRSLRERNLVSASALDAASADVAALEARLAAAGAEVRVARDNEALIQQDLDDLVIRAPFTGVVISKNAQPGEMISPISAGGGFTRTGIGTIVDMDSREIEVDVNEAYINRVRPGQPVSAVLDAYPDWDIPAQVINIVPTADRNRATVKVRIAFQQLDDRILPDMGVRVRFLEEQLPAQSAQTDVVALIPTGAVVSIDGKDLVWIVSNGKLERRAIRLGEPKGKLTEVLAGLSPGQRVVTQPSPQLEDGAEVSVEQE